MSDCDKYRQLINRGFEGSLGDEDAIALSNHLESCAECRAEFEVGNFADGLMLALAAPEIDAEVWRLRSEALGIAGDEGIGLPADAIRPPDVSDEEWDRVWLDIERRTLLDGIAAPGKIQRVRLRRALGTFAAAVLVVAVVAAYFYLAPSPLRSPPEKKADVVAISEGYLYSELDIGGQYPVHEIALTGDVRDVQYLAAGRGYLKSSGDSGVPEITAAENMRTSRISAGAGYMYSPAEDGKIDEIGDRNDLEADGYDEIPEFPPDESSLPRDASGGGNN